MKTTFRVPLMPNQFVKIKVVILLYQKKLSTLAQTHHSIYDGHFKTSVSRVLKLLKHRHTHPPPARATFRHYFAYNVKTTIIHKYNELEYSNEKDI